MKRQLYQEDLTGPETDFHENLQLRVWDEGLSAVLVENTMFLVTAVIWLDDKRRIRH